MRAFRADMARHLITIQVPVRSQSAENALSIAWATLYSVKAAIVPFSRTGPGVAGREFDFAGERRSDSTHLIIMRAFSPTITTDMRFIFGTRVFNILVATMTDQVRHEWTVQVRENTSVLDSTTALYTVVTNDSGAFVTNDDGLYLTVLT